MEIVGRCFKSENNCLWMGGFRIQWFENNISTHFLHKVKNKPLFIK